MQSLKILSAFDLLPVSLLVCLLILVENIWLRIIVGIASAIFFLRNNRKNIILWAFIVLLVLRPVSIKLNEVYEGRVIHVNSYGYVIQCHSMKVLLNTDEVLHLDDCVTYKGEYSRIANNLSTYGYNKQTSYAKKGIYYEIYPEKIEVVHGNGLIHRLYVRTLEINNEFIRSLLFNTGNEENVFLSLGFGVTLFLLELRKLCIHFFKERIVTVLMCFGVLYGYLRFSYEYALLRLLVSLLLMLVDVSSKDRAALNGLVLMVLMPSNVNSVSFILPFYFRIQNALRVKKTNTLLGSWFIQSFYMNQVNPIMLIVFTFFRQITGYLFGIGLLQVITGIPFFNLIIPVLDRVSGFTDLFVLKGSVKGIGIVLYYVLYCSFKVYKQKELLGMLLFMFFMITGLFHPMAEVCFVNVGQGDAILFKPAFVNSCILLDTGKATSYNQLSAALNGRGIRKISTLFISHGDDDHNGGIGLLTADYKIQAVIDQHFDSYTDGTYTFYDLNDSNSDEENERGLVLMTSIQGLNYLFMADVPVAIEERICQRYQFKVDVIKLGHHGSHTSTGDKLLSCFQPDLAVISAGKENVYHHPHEEVLQRLLRFHVPYLSTQSEGDISLYFILGRTILITSKGTVALVG